MTKNQARGYLYEVVIAHLLEKNGFLRCLKNNAIDHQYNCGIISEDGEIEGRGTAHQIDFIGVFNKSIPFIYPIRVLVECKFWTEKDKNNHEKYKTVDKSFVREYLGIYKDISENYHSTQMHQKTRFLDLPIIFSAGGFHQEAEKLGWAQGINLISHSKLPIMKDILDLIEIFINNLPPISYTKKENFQIVKQCFDEILNNKNSQNCHFHYKWILFLERSLIKNNQFDRLLDCFIRIQQKEYKTFLFATTNHGKILNLIGYEDFPDNLFINTNEQDCEILFYSIQNDDQRIEDDISNVFFIQLNNDTIDRKFYFQAGDALLDVNFSNLPVGQRIEHKKQYFKKLTILKDIENRTRLLTLNVNFRDNRE